MRAPRLAAACVPSEDDRRTCRFLRTSFDVHVETRIREETEMRFMLIVKATDDTEAGIPPSTELLEAMGNFNEELVNAGVLLAGEGLHPSSKGARVLFSGQKRRVVDGPFTEAKELIAGFWLIQAKSIDEAIEWVKRVPNPTGEESVIEIRQVFEIEDFGEAATPDVREQEERLRARVESQR
jgi:hypothetical protein